MTPLRIAWTTFIAVPLFLLMLALFGCAAGGGPPPSATAIPYDPALLTVPRKDEADRWAADVARRQYVETYLNALCSPDGPWSKMREGWVDQQKSVWKDVLWHFQPIPNAPASGGIGGVDIGAIIGSVLGGAIKGALVAPPRSSLPPGLPAC